MSKQPDQMENIICEKCDIPLSLGKVGFSYSGAIFEVELYRCPQCKMVFIPEELATGRMQEVERTMEDK